MRLEYLEECINLAETLNFTQTAKRFYLTQPVLSKHISSLEKELGIQIFLRDQRRIRLTKAGHQIIVDAKKTIAAHHDMLENIKMYKEGISSCVKIGFLREAGSSLTLASHPIFQKKHPSVDLTYYPYDISELRQALFDSEIDIAILNAPNEFPDDVFRSVSIFTDYLCAAMLPSHPLAHKHKPLTSSDFTGETVVLLCHSFYPSESSELLEWLNPEKNNVVVEDSLINIDALPLMLSIKNCVGLVPSHLKHYCNSRLDEGCTFIPLEGFSQISFSAVWKKANDKEFLEDYAQTLKETARNQAAELLPKGDGMQ